MTDKQLTEEWIEYDGDYCKAMQDIRTNDGKEYLMCWPNAGIWCVLGGKKQIDIANHLVTHVRKTQHPDW